MKQLCRPHRKPLPRKKSDKPDKDRQQTNTPINPNTETNRKKK